MKKSNILYALVVVALLAILLMLVLDNAYAAEKCSGSVYQNHPGLLAECLHQQTVRHDNQAYPGPLPYPEPIVPTPEPTKVAGVDCRDPKTMEEVLYCMTLFP